MWEPLNQPYKFKLLILFLSHSRLSWLGCETLSCAHDTISAIIISQQLQQPAMGLNKTGPVTSQSWTGEGLIRSYLSLLKYCLLMEPREMQPLSSAVNPRWTQQAPLDSSKLMVTQMTLVKPGDSKNKTERRECWENTCREVKGDSVGSEINTCWWWQ